MSRPVEWTDGSWVEHFNPTAEVSIGRGCRIPAVTDVAISVTERFVLGDYSTIHAGATIEGRDVEIGQEAWILPGAIIGGGSCFERPSRFRAGHFLHLGRDTFVNTARPVELGNEVGLGTRTALYTHGAYLSALDGFPVAFAPITIGDRVWLPGATVNPGVRIGADVVVAVGSVVTRNLPAGCLAAGIPAAVVKANAYPAPLVGDAAISFWGRFLNDWAALGEDPSAVAVLGDELRIDGARFYHTTQRISGPVSPLSERLRDQLRRYGIRFYSRPGKGDQYEDWR